MLHQPMKGRWSRPHRIAYHCNIGAHPHSEPQRGRMLDLPMLLDSPALKLGPAVERSQEGNCDQIHRQTVSAADDEIGLGRRAGE